MNRASLTINLAMALLRILVDGYSLLHNWPSLAPGKPRHGEAARQELIRRLTLYGDAVGIPITVVFDGGGAPPGPSSHASSRQLEIIYSSAGKTADDVIERVTARMRPLGEVLAVTDDYAERDMVISLGGLAVSCANFMDDIERTLKEQTQDIGRINRRERLRFKMHR